MPPQPQPIRQDSQTGHPDMSHTMNRYPSQGGRGSRGSFNAHNAHNPHFQQPSPQPYRTLPNMGGQRPFQPQGPMQRSSPFQQNRSPAITPATMHQQAHLANPQGMNYYPGQQYPQPVGTLFFLFLYFIFPSTPPYLPVCNYAKAS